MQKQEKGEENPGVRIAFHLVVRLYHTVSSTSRSPQISGQLIRDAITVYRVVYQQDDLVRQRRVKRCRDNFRARNRRAAVRPSASVLPRPPPSLI